MSRRWKRAKPFKSLIQRTFVDVSVINLLVALWLDPHLWHLCQQNLWMRFRKHTHLVVPSASFNEKTIHKGSFRRILLKVILLFIWANLEHELDLVNSNCVLSRKVLLKAGEETLCEVESWHPKHCWSIIVNPVLNELKTKSKVNNVRGEWLQRGVRSLHPHLRYPVIEQCSCNLFQIWAHHNLTLDCLLQRLQWISYQLKQSVESQNFLLQNSVQWLCEFQRMFLCC